MHKLKSSHINLTKKERIYGCEIPIVALTGSIATGKSTVSKILREQGFPLVDADSLVKEIYATEEAKLFITKLNPSLVIQNRIDFNSLRKMFFSDKKLKATIEEFIYNRLATHFLKKVEILDLSKVDFLFYDVPLLFEKKLEQFFDINVLVYCSQVEQLERLTKRDRIEKELALSMIKSQILIDAKRQKSDFIIENNSSLEELKTNVKDFIRLITL